MFSHDSQQCEACSDSEYIITPDTDQCQRCPPGLRCSGDDTVLPVLDGSTWVPEGDAYILTSCPTGYEIFNASVESQECRVCSFGKECTASPCTVCYPCSAGTYKDSASASACRACPEGTFGPEVGATTVEQCVDCPAGATSASAQTSAEACVCLDEFYPITSDNVITSCQVCPFGARCEDDGWCRFSRADLSCPAQDSALVGEWEKEADGTWTLLGCPEGYQLVNSTDGTSSGTFSASAQHCLACSEDAQYIIDPNTDECQRCPPGLRCFGNSTVVPVLDGSTWVTAEEDGSGVYKLAGCPTGFAIFNESASLQECRVCGLGESCELSVCMVCASCPPGYYKDSVGPDACTPCPRSTYGESAGAINVAQCTYCPFSSETTSVGHSNPEACQCPSYKYLAWSQITEQGHQCVTCPAGAKLPGGGCAFRNSSSPDTAGAVGDWVVGEDGRFMLVSCPAGTSLVNSTEGTSSGVFSHDAQQCLACLSPTQYIMNPNTDSCQRCPPGLKCFGNATIFPVVPGSSWVPEDGVWVLTSCPSGYSVYNVTERQECKPCGLGEECTDQVCVSCTSCSPGTYKHMASTTPCTACPANTYATDSGATSVASCLACPRNSFTGSPGMSSVDSCTCDPRMYRVETASSVQCLACPVGAVCSDGACALAFGNKTCSDNSSAIGAWVRDPTDGLFKLESCPAGYQRINSVEGTASGTFSHGVQQCHKCTPEFEYIVDTTDGECQPCPLGLVCQEGDDEIELRIRGSQWTLDEDGVYRLDHCPPGYRIYNLTVELQECQFCEKGSQCVLDDCKVCTQCPAGTFKTTDSSDLCEACPTGTYSDAVGAIARSTCRACPIGSTTANGTAATSIDECSCDDEHYASSDAGEDLKCEVCPVGATCPDGRCALSLPRFLCNWNSLTSAPTGDWTRANSGEYILNSCPDGYALINSTGGTSQGEFSHFGQQCRECLPKYQFYIIFDVDGCQTCPEGLVCDGDWFVIPQTNGSDWRAEGVHYKLKSCPLGYRLYNFTQELQECQPCGYGESCDSEGCFQCQECPAGTYKDSISPQQCQPCPINTYGPDSMASTLTQCRACPDHATTAGEGSTSASQCVCDAKYYEAVDGDDRKCLTCPLGARCDDGSCALALESLTCPDSTQTVGTWELAEDGTYRLVSCPEGYSLVNSADGTSSGDFFQEVQQCRPCTEGQYILNPNTDQCQDCPPGLTCDGTASVDYVTPGAEWVVVGDEYILESCPTGYRKYNFTQGLQECQLCGFGESCVEPVCYVCTPCPAGQYKDSISAQACGICPPNTFGAQVGATSLTDCTECPAFSSTASEGSTMDSDCVCSQGYYPAGDSNERTCNRCPIGATCSDGSCALASDPITCPAPEGPPVGEWVQDEGTHTLVSCPEGHSLVNSTDGTSSGEFLQELQQCKACLATDQYILNPNTDQCQECSPGLTCNGTSIVVPVVEGSEWVVVGDEYILESCPSGYRLYNLTTSLQECQPCSFGEQCVQDGCSVCSECLPGTYKGVVGPQPCRACPLNTYRGEPGAASRADCTACPEHAITSDTGATGIEECVCDSRYYPITEGSGFRCYSCPAGAVCADGSCAFARADGKCANSTLPVGEWAEQSDGTQLLQNCPAGYMLVNSSAGTSSGTFSNEAQQCRACILGEQYVLDDLDTCKPCPPGLVCTANGVTPVVPGSVWNRNDDEYELQSCPPGYRFYNLSPELQECQACPRGTSCETDPCPVCVECAAGKFKDSNSNDTCSECPVNTYNDRTGASSFADCKQCHASAFTAGPGSTQPTDCECALRHYYGVVERGSATCYKCPEGALCTDGKCFEESTATPCRADGEPMVGEWNRDGPEGPYTLDGCPDGYQLINSTSQNSEGVFSNDAQMCLKCLEDVQYILSDMDECQTCPPGLICDGTSNVEEVVDGSVWEEEDGELKLKSCPEGYRLYNFTSWLQECQPCGLGEQCDKDLCHVCTPCPAGQYKDIRGPHLCRNCPLSSYGPEIGATERDQCLECPAFSRTELDGRVHIEDCECDGLFYLATPEGPPVCMNCPVGGICPTRTCAFRVDPRRGISQALPFCAGNGSVIGEWALANDTTWKLLSCPAGHQLVNSLDGTSSGEFSHDAQHCSECLLSEYIVDPNVHECQRCPPGLICRDGVVIREKVEGSVWDIVDGVYHLRSCPIGYRIYDEAPELHECRECTRGTECAEGNCTECTDCVPGYYKLTNGPQLCQACPRNTFNPITGAAAIENCIQCNTGAVTDGEGKDDPLDCECVETMYTIWDVEESMVSCVACPYGAVCPDGTCALRTDNHTCPPTDIETAIAVNETRGVLEASSAWTKIPGVWTRDNSSFYRVRSCPAGHKLINSTDATAFGEYSHDLQQCHKCRHCVDGEEWCRASDYIADAILYECQPCPIGAECNGNSLRTANGLDTYDPPAQWELDNVTGILHLVQCPTGFKMETLIGVENQQCAQCPDGWFIAASDNPNIICYVCPASATCPNGGPPLFAHSAVTSSIVLQGITAMDITTQNAIAAAIADAMGVRADQIEVLEVCPVDAAGTTSGCTKLRRGIRSARGRSLLQTSGLELSFRVPAAIGKEGTVLSNLTTDSFSSSVSGNLASHGVPITVAPSGSANLELSNFVGEKFELTANGAPKLLDCESGYLLVNNTINSQECSFCAPKTYSVNPFDKCSIAKKYCEKRDCSPCSAGAQCRGGDNFEPHVKSTEWAVEYIPEENSWLYRIRYAPPGYIMIRGSSAQDDQAIACNVGEYALEPGVPEGEVMFKRTLASFVPDSRLCLPCPKGAYCSGQVGVMAEPRWWRGTSMRCRESACNSRGCSPTKCHDLYDTDFQTEGGDQVRARAMLYRCIIPGVCEQKDTPETLLRRRLEEGRRVDEVEDNGCKFGHAGPLCGVCLFGWAPSLGRCIKCENTGFTYVPALIITALVIVLGFGYYMMSWTPLLDNPDKQPNILVKTMKKYEWEKIRDATKVMTGFFQVGGSFITTFAVDWPPKLTAMLAVASSLMSFDFLSIPGLTCLTSTIPFTYQMMISTLIPVVGIVFLLLPLFYAKMFRRAERPPDDMTREIEEQWKKLEERRGKLDVERREIHSLLERLPAEEDMTGDGEAKARVAELRARFVARHQKLWKDDLEYEKARMALEKQAQCAMTQLELFERHSNSKKKTFQAFWHALFLLLFITYPAASRISIKAFACKHLGSDGTWVRDDMSYPCPRPDTDPFTFFWAAFSTLMIPIGVPSYCIYKFIEHQLPRLAREKNEAEVISGFLSKMVKMETKLFNFKDKFGDAPDGQGINRKIKFAMKQVMKCVCHKCDACETVKCPDCNQCRHNRKKGVNKHSILGPSKKKKCGTCADYTEIKKSRTCVRCGFLVTDNSSDCKLLHPEDWEHEEKRWFGTKTREPESFDIQKLGQLMWEMGLTTFDDNDLIRLINLHGYNGKINRRQVRTAMRELCMRLKYKQIVVRGHENPNLLTDTQLKVLCEEPWERQVGYNHLTYASGVSGVLDGTSFMHAKAGLTDLQGKLKPETSSKMTAEEQKEFQNNHDKYEYASRSDLVRCLAKKGLNFAAYGDVTVQNIKWDGKSALERKAIEDLGFLFLTYKPRCWWYELFELMRKLVIVGTLAFVWDGTSSQVAVGFFITIFCLIFALNVRPFANPILERLYFYALVVQSGTLLYGLYLITEKFDEITGEDKGGDNGAFNVRDLVLGFNCTIFALPFIMIGSDFRQMIMNYVIHIKNMCLPAWCIGSVATKQRRELGVISNHRQTSTIDITTLKTPRHGAMGSEELPQAHGDDSDGESDKVVQNEWDAFQQMPTAAEFGGIVRMERHCELIEARVFDLLRHQAEQEYGDDFDRTLEDVKILLDRAKIDAAVLQEEMPTGEAQDQLEHIAFGTLDYIQVLCDNLSAQANRPRSVDYEISSNKSDWSAVLMESPTASRG